MGGVLSEILNLVCDEKTMPSLIVKLDMWAVGCIFAELLTLKPLFQGAEVKATPNPFQVNCHLNLMFSVHHVMI